MMKRSAGMEEELTYECAIKKAQLVERNPHPNGVDLIDPRRVSKHEATDIISLASQIQNADKQIKTGTSQKLCLILDQIRMLQAQAMEILKESEESRSLHSAACNFAKKPGQVYHLYLRSSGQSYFSMLSPDEWNGAVDQKYLGSFRLELDHTWTPLDKIRQRDEKMQWAERCITAAENSGGNSTSVAIDFSFIDRTD